MNKKRPEQPADSVVFVVDTVGAKRPSYWVSDLSACSPSG